MALQQQSWVLQQVPSSAAQQLTWAREEDIALEPYKVAMNLEEPGYILDEGVANLEEGVAVLAAITFFKLFLFLTF